MIFILIILGFLSTAFYALTPYVIGETIDLMNYGMTDFTIIKAKVLLIVGLYLLSFVTTIFLNLLSQKYAAKHSEKLRRKLIDKTLKVPFSRFDIMNHSQINNYLSLDSNLVLDGLAIFLTQAITGVFTIILALILMLRTNVSLTLIVLIASPFIYKASKYLAVQSKKAFEAQQASFDQMIALTKDHLDNEVIMKAYQYQKTAKIDFEQTNTALNYHSRRAQIFSAFVNPSTRFLNNILYVLIAALGAYLMSNSAITVGAMISFVSYSLMFSKPINELSSAMGQISAAQAADGRIQEYLKLNEEIDEGKAVTVKQKDIQFKDVCFSYVKGNPLIDNFNLDIKKNSKIAIVGPTGAGKSTIINLLMRFYELDSGTIYLGDDDIQALSLSNSREHISIVLQTPWVFTGTVYDNIRYSNPKASDEEVEQAAKKARAHQFIMQMDQGYQSVINENLSLGEKQRISIARALLIERPIYILDEASSNLDAVTEKQIQSVFDDIMKNHTSFFVAHRLNTVVDADQIIFMNEGKIEEIGTHDELMNKKGLYYQMYQANM